MQYVYQCILAQGYDHQSEKYGLQFDTQPCDLTLSFICEMDYGKIEQSFDNNCHARSLKFRNHCIFRLLFRLAM